MKSIPIIEPAPLVFDAAGVPFSPRYDDIYHSAESGPGQALHVFLGGNALPRRWGGQNNFTILETGFGLGMNFLATWRTWRDDPLRCNRLHYAAVEKHPFTVEALSLLHAKYKDFAPLSAELLGHWPVLVPGIHRLCLDQGRVLLTLAFGDVAEILPKFAVQADAIYLDGFSPARNPEMWTPALIKALARKAQPGTTLATYTSAGAVRRALETQGFTCEKRPGFGQKREMLCANYAPRWPHRSKPTWIRPSRERHALVIGAGLAGSAVCERLASRGWRITLIEAFSKPAMGASGLRAGVFHPHASPDDCLLSRLTRHAYLQGLGHWRCLAKHAHSIEWSRCGVLQLPHRAVDEDSMARTLASLNYPKNYARYVDADEASKLAGCRVSCGGWWFPEGGWIRSPTLVAAQLAAAGTQLNALYGTIVHRLERKLDRWHALAPDGSLIAEAPVAIIANAAEAQNLVDFGAPLRRIRGQLSFVPRVSTIEPRIVVSGMGYALPPVGGILVTGSTYETEEVATLPAYEAHAANLARLSRLLPELTCLPLPESLSGEHAIRAVARDRLPLVGGVPDIEAARGRQSRLTGAQLHDLPRLQNLYCATGFGSRGIIWSVMAGEFLASLLEGEPLPIESDLADAIDPGRFVLRSLRHGHL